MLLLLRVKPQARIAEHRPETPPHARRVPQTPSIDDFPFTFFPPCQQRVATLAERIQNLLRDFSAGHGISARVKQPQLGQLVERTKSWRARGKEK